MKLEVLSKEECAVIHAAALKVLEETGVKVEHEVVRQRLLEAGAKEAARADVLLFPSKMVKEYLALAPSRLRFATMAGEVREFGPESFPVFWTAAGLNILDNGLKRPTKEADMAAVARISEELASVFAVVGISIGEYPPFARDFAGFRIIAENTTKHIRPVIFTPRGIEAFIEMAQALLGSTPIREKPIFSLGYCILSPLHWGRSALEVFLRSSGHGIPIMINSEPTGGATSPVTLAGTTVVTDAEEISGIVICQVLEPGRPCLYNSGFTHVLDMRTASVVTGGPENALFGAICSAMAKYHGFVSASWMCTDSPVDDEQASYEKALTGLSHALSGVNMIWGVGQLEAEMTLSLPQFVVDDEVAGMAQRICRGVRADEDSLALDLVLERGPASEYLSTEHTLQRFRSELYEPRLSQRARRQRWEELGAKDTLARARERVADILARRDEPLLDPARSRELRRIEKQWLDRLSRA